MPPPDRWDAYCPRGKVIPGTKFIAFKVPLKEALLQTVAEEEKFSPSILLAQLGEQGLTLAGVIDLTFTWKYYNKEDFLSKSVDHKKVFTKGHEVPSDAVYKKFTEAVESFNDTENLIGVHCTHGVNRTGYLICRYMIEKLKKEPQEAIDLFNEARGHNLERENYLEDLKKRRSGEEMLGVTPEVPAEDDRGWRRRKPRWRSHREDHPDWRRSCDQRPSHDASVPHAFPQPPWRDQGGHWRDAKNFQRDGRSSFSNNSYHSQNNPCHSDFNHREGYGRNGSQPFNGGNGAFHDDGRKPRWHDSSYRQYHWQTEDYPYEQYQGSERGGGHQNEDRCHWRDREQNFNRHHQY